MNSESASKGFKTFILTLAISLLVFSGIYYVVTNYASEKSFMAVSDTEVSYNTVSMEEDEEVRGVYDSRSSFGELAAMKDLDAAPQQVLAGADVVEETTQSTTAVPETGVFGVTLGLFVSFLLFGVGLFVVYLNPRNLAISSFEKRVTR